MLPFWRSPAAARAIAEQRKARFAQIAREAYEHSRDALGPQKLKPRDWETDCRSGRRPDELGGKET
jgi:hypothetical protein